MSQYALYLSKQHKHPDSKISYSFNNFSQSQHNGYELEKVFGIKCSSKRVNRISNFIYRIYFGRKYKFVLKVLKAVLRKINIYCVIEKANYDFDESILNHNRGTVLYYGGWHSEKYFLDISNTIKKTFEFSLTDLNAESIKILQRIKFTNSIGMHIRRGDYMNPEHYSVFGCVCTLDYYKKAINYIKSKVSNPVFFVFSNDLEWVKDNIEGVELFFVDCNNNKDSWMDMCLMSYCNHNIISNSTFSWWGAWLNNNDDKIVLCPHEFIHNVRTKDFYPQSWIKI